MKLTFDINEPLSLTFDTGRTVVTSDNKGVDVYMYTSPIAVEELPDTEFIPYNG